ncbi:glucokinase [Litorisediminicola beolgyonensis]|uniref:Glucokinase n=1 Tax=Litorisediminicola beolgyonensis TaxID=1173614 RepID=A0ABW3ZHD6_9RHOB
MADQTAVVADIGGTNTRVALAHGAEIETGSIRRYRNAEVSGLGEVLEHYLAEIGASPEAACVAMAGPVRDGIGKLTNLNWSIDRKVISEASGATTVAVLNDLQAQGHALDRLGPESLVPLLPGQPASPQAAKLVVGVGTGLNAAPVYRLGGQTLVPPSESGHITMPTPDAETRALRDWIAQKHPQPGIEDALSGRGFERIYAWLAEDAGAAPKDAAAIMESTGDDPLADKAVRIFTRMLGRLVGDLALVSLPFGGIYLCGGVARHFEPHLKSGTFEEALTDKGRFSEFMRQFPVHLVADDYAALTGSACHLAELMGQREDAA